MPRVTMFLCRTLTLLCVHGLVPMMASEIRFRAGLLLRHRLILSLNVLIVLRMARVSLLLEWPVSDVVSGLAVPRTVRYSVEPGTWTFRALG